MKVSIFLNISVEQFPNVLHSPWGGVNGKSFLSHGARHPNLNSPLFPSGLLILS